MADSSKTTELGLWMIKIDHRPEYSRTEAK